MSRRYSCKACAAAAAGTVHAHLLGAAPDEWAINLRGPSPASDLLYIQGAPSTTCITVCSSAVAGTCDVFAHVNHSIVK
jgi:hypothetical protein